MDIHDFVVARVLHVLGVVLWIGGVAFVTLVLLPAAVRHPDTAQGIAAFEQFERRFSLHARVWTLLTGLSGFYITWRLDLWSRFAEIQFWWMHAMVALWLVFSAVLFVLEPLFLHRWFSARARHNPAGTLRLVSRIHWVLLTASLITLAGAVAGSHGGL
jgi:uncharacterized membrane protein